ncbi:hypothetical protein GCM10022206_86750 [Streptomyces chiangmaiensis]
MRLMTINCGAVRPSRMPRLLRCGNFTVAGVTSAWGLSDMAVPDSGSRREEAEDAALFWRSSQDSVSAGRGKGRTGGMQPAPWVVVGQDPDGGWWG